MWKQEVLYLETTVLILSSLTNVEPNQTRTREPHMSAYVHPRSPTPAARTAYD